MEGLVQENKTRGLRRWPTRETILLRCNMLNPGSTEIYEINVRNSELFGASVPTFQEYLQMSHSELEISFCLI